DDGPDPRWTPAVLQLLAARAPRAPSSRGARNPLPLRALRQTQASPAAQTGNHRAPHPHLARLAAAGAQAEGQAGARPLSPARARLLSALKGRGYGFVTVSELLAAGRAGPP